MEHMETMGMQTLPGVASVFQMLTADLVRDIAYRSEAGLLVPVYKKPTAIPILGDAKCELTEQPDNNAQVEKVTLTFRTSHRLDTSQPLAFVVRTVQGQTYLIGTRERPFPTVKVSHTTGAPSGDASVYEVQVSLTHRKALVRVVM